MTGPAAGSSVAPLSVVPLETSMLGNRSYLVHDGRTAFAVDPQRDIDRVLELLNRLGLRLSHVFETHIHNDYVTGGLALARRTGAAYLVNGADKVGFTRTPLDDGTVTEVGERMRVEAVATPGHTFTHLSYVLHDAASGRDTAVFTGGSMLYGTTGRPDLLGAAHTRTLARLQHRSVRRLAARLADDVAVYPTHGFGSFCAATPAVGTESTIGFERRRNPALVQDVDVFVDQVCAQLVPYPAYYAHMAPLNATGPLEARPVPPRPLDPAELRRRIVAGEWVVDLRSRTAFAAGYVPGTVNVGTDGNFVTYLGWLVEWGAPLTLLGESTEQVLHAQRELARIGIERFAGVATGEPAQWSDRPLGRYPIRTFLDLAAVLRTRPVRVLDVRRADEAGDARLAGAVNIPLHELRERVAELPSGEVWVHCASGYRASVAVSLLLKLRAEGRLTGVRPVVVDDEFAHARLAGLPLVGAVA